MKTILITCSILAGLFGARQSFGQAGNLDLTFDTDGIVTTQIGLSEMAYSTAVQPDGKILVAGYSGISLALIRYNEDGTLDNSFGAGGIVSIIIATASSGSSLAIQPDGKILVAGLVDTGTEYDFVLVRFTQNGSLDTTFNTNGWTTTSFDVFDFAKKIVLQSDGKIIVTGYSQNAGNYTISVARYNANGSLDNSFSSDGKVSIPFEGGIYSAAIQSNGKILLTGYSWNGVDADFILIQINTNGELDTNFGTNAIVITDFGLTSDYAHTILIQPDNKIVLGGSSGDHFALVRYHPNGSIDNSFGTNGKVSNPIGAYYSDGYSMALQPDEKIYLAGYSWNGTDNDLSLARYNTNGTLDSSFNFIGSVTTDIDSGGDNKAYSVALQPDGKIILAGTSNNGIDDDFAVSRYISDYHLGIIDFTTINYSELIYPNPIMNNSVLEYTLLKEEKINICLLDIQGKELKRMVDNKIQIAGTYTISLSTISELPTGSYILQITGNKGTVAVRIVK